MDASTTDPPPLGSTCSKKYETWASNPGSSGGQRRKVHEDPDDDAPIKMRGRKVHEDPDDAPIKMRGPRKRSAAEDEHQQWCMKTKPWELGRVDFSSCPEWQQEEMKAAWMNAVVHEGALPREPDSSRPHISAGSAHFPELPYPMTFSEAAEKEKEAALRAENEAALRARAKASKIAGDESIAAAKATDAQTEETDKKAFHFGTILRSRQRRDNAKRPTFSDASYV